MNYKKLMLHCFFFLNHSLHVNWSEFYYSWDFFLIWIIFFLFIKWQWCMWCKSSFPHPADRYPHFSGCFLNTSVSGTHFWQPHQIEGANDRSWTHNSSSKKTGQRLLVHLCSHIVYKIWNLLNVDLSHLFSSEIYLKVLSRFLGDSASKVKLIDLTGLIP